MTITLVQSKLSQVTASTLNSAWNGITPTSGNLRLLRVVAGNGVSSAETITDPAHWAAVYGTQPTGSSGTSRAALQLYWAICDGTANDNAPSIALSANSRALCELSEYHSTNGWPTNPLDVTFTAATANGTSPATGSGGTTAASALIVAEIIQISGSTSTTWGGSLAADVAAIQGTSNLFTANQIVTSATTLTPGATMGASGLYIIGAASFKDNAPPSTEVGSWGLAAA